MEEACTVVYIDIRHKELIDHNLPHVCIGSEFNPDQINGQS